jgi:hypothetical protein
LELLHPRLVDASGQGWIAALELAVWGERNDWLPAILESERAVDPGAITIIVAEAGESVVGSTRTSSTQRETVRRGQGSSCGRRSSTRETAPVIPRSPAVEHEFA